MKKRFKTPKAKDGELLVKGQYGGECDLFYCWPKNDESMVWDCKLIMIALQRNVVFRGSTLIEELERRGYDITTLKFSIQKKAENENYG